MTFLGFSRILRVYNKKEKKKMKINELIKALQSIQKQAGNVSVLVAADPEGNFYCDLGKSAAKLNAELIDENTVAVFPVRKLWADEVIK